MGPRAAIRLHRREPWLDGNLWTVLSVRPEEPATFTARLHADTWHLAGDAAAAVVLGELFWALAFQRHQRTVILIDASPSPILLVNASLEIPSTAMVAELAALLPFATPSLGTVKLRTAGLVRALAEPEASEVRAGFTAPADWQKCMKRESDALLVYAAPDAMLRGQAVALATAGELGGESGGQGVCGPMVFGAPGEPTVLPG